MPDIKKYSTLFASKIVYVLSQISPKSKAALVTQVSEITEEKDSTARNWLFNAKIPRVPKRLKIADKIGVSEEYLFNDNFPIEGYQKPVAALCEGHLLIPFLQEEEIFDFYANKIFPVLERIPFMLPNLDKVLQRYGNNIFATKIKKSNFQPHFNDNTTVIFSDLVELEEYKFVLVKGTPLKIKRIIKDGERIILLSYGDNDQEIIEDITSKKGILSVIVAFSL